MLSDHGPEERDLRFLDTIDQPSSDHVVRGIHGSDAVVAEFGGRVDSPVDFRLKDGGTGVEVEISEFRVEVSSGQLACDSDEINLG